VPENFGVTWPGVGCYNQNATHRNFFQVVLVDRSDVAAGDFDIEFNYDQIQWETGDFSGGSNGLLQDVIDPIACQRPATDAGECKAVFISFQLTKPCL